MEEGNLDRVVAIDIETGEFEVADDPIAASDRLFVRCPDAQPRLVRIGHRALYRLMKPDNRLNYETASRKEHVL